MEKTRDLRDTEERLALAEIEHRLRRIRTRLNLYTVQHNFYSFGTVLALGAAGLVVAAFTLSPFLFILLAWLLLAVSAFLLFVFWRRAVTSWSDLPTAARHIDARAALKERLSTLATQLAAVVRGNAPPSRLWPHLIEENTARLPAWEIKKVAPSRVPWSFLPFMTALLLALVIAFLPLLSSWGSIPFSLDNIQTVLSELPDRIAQMVEQQLSLRPEQMKDADEEAMFGEDGDIDGAGDDQGGDGNNSGRSTERGRKPRSFASLPQALQKAIRQALRGLQDEGRDGEGEEIFLPNSRLARRFGKGKNPMGESVRRTPGGRRDQADDGEAGEGVQSPAQGSGIQQLGRARLDRKNARGTFQPPNQQVQGSGGQSGSSGSGAGTGTDPRLFGNQANLEGDANTFQLALDATYEKGTGSEGEVEDEGGAVEKSGKGLSQRQSLDDAIRKAQVPPEYEEIVKRLFSRGESQ